VHAGRLLPIEQALAEVRGAGEPAPRPAAPGPVARPTAAPASLAPPPARTGPSPFEMDRAKKAANRPPEPQSSGANALAAEPAPQPQAVGDARERLHACLTANGHPHLADAVENAAIAVAGADLQIVAPKSYALYFNDRNFADAVREVFGRPLRVRITAGEVPAVAPSSAGQAPAAPQASAPGDDEVTGRALSNPEVQRFREVFGGEVRRVRNLKE